jgi:hypothetical protein
VFYKPNFCCHCGEKIERADWSLTTSRRFCEVCQSSFTLHERGPQIFVALMAVVGLFGFGSYLGRAEKPPALSNRPLVSPASRANVGAGPEAENRKANVRTPAANGAANAGEQPASSGAANRPPAANAARAKAPDESEAVYFCGAPTRKGTPCSRRVKGGGRCWQHQAQEATLPPEKLIAK